MRYGSAHSHSLTAAVALALAANTAGAQESTALEEIFVTAQKRAESLQEVPLAISAVSGEKIAESGIMKIEDLRNFVPTLWMTETAIGNNIAIRGVFSGVNPGFEQSVGTYVDGIYRGRPQQTRAPFMDIERVEVLRGPQSILFGKNSIAGALNITSARPTDELDAAVSMLYEPDFDEQEYSGYLSGPLTDNLRGRLAARYRETDGHMTNLTLDTDEPSREETNVRAILEWDVTDAVTLSLKAETGEFDVVGRQIEIYEEIPVPGAPSATNPFGGRTYSQILAALGQDASVLNNYPDYRRSSNGDYSNNDTEEYVFTVDWKIGESMLTAITGYSKYEFEELCDCDFTGGNVFNVAMAEEFDQTSQEIRLASPVGGRFEYIVGAYYEESDLAFADTIVLPASSVLVPLLNNYPAFRNTPLQGIAGTAIADTASPRLFVQESRAWSVFGQLTWNVGDDFRATGGLRYTSEEKEASRDYTQTTIDFEPLSGLQAAVAPTVYALVFNARQHSLSGSRDEDQLLPSLILEYDWGDSVMTYLSWSQGSKSGGFDARSNNPTVPPATECLTAPVPGQPRNPAGCLYGREIGTFEFEDENADNIELGAKMGFGGNFELNAALYFTNFKDMQVSTFDGSLGFNVRNAGEADIMGIELDARWQASVHSMFTGAMAWTDFEYKDYYGQCAFGQVPDAPDGINCNYKGKTNEFVADWVATLAYDYRRPISSSLEFRFGVDVYYTTETFVNPTLDERQKQDAYAKLNGRIGIGAEHWEVAVLGRNLTDEEIYPYGNDTPLAGTTFGAWSAWRFTEASRTVAMQATVRF